MPPPARSSALALGRPRACLAALLAVLAAVFPARATGQSLPRFVPESEQATTAVEEPVPDRARAQLDEVLTELAGVEARLKTANTEAAAVLSEEQQILERIASHLRQQIATAEQIEAERVAAEDLSDDIELVEATGPSLQPPYGYLLLESLRDELRDQEQRARRLLESVDVASEARTRARETLDSRQRARRQAREAVDSQSDPSPTALRLARRTELETRAADQQLLLRQLELEREQTALGTQNLRVRRVRAEHDYVAPRTELTADDRERIQTDISLRETRTRADAETARGSLKYATDRWDEARRRLDEAGGADPVLLVEVAAHKAEQERRRAELDAIEKRLAYLDQMRELWSQRFATFAEVEDKATVRGWCATAETDLDTLQSEERLAAGLMSDARQKIVTLDAQIESSSSVEVVRWLRQQRTAEQAQVGIYEDQLTAIEELRRLREKFLSDARSTQSGIDVTAFLGATWEKVLRFWNHELYSVADRPITPGKIAWGLLILLLGGWVAKRISLFLGSRILPSFGLNEGALHAFEVLSFYLLVITFGLLALKVVNIPLTAFTILGGALAIGFGFGSQNIVNNFISGLILLTEQPVRVADLIQVGELYGTVQHIGLRSTRIRTGSNIELIVPNSSFLEQNVVNWTLNDTKTRIHVAVGVAYGSSLRKVKEILKRAATEHGRVLKSPEPVVIFNNFGDNALEFEIHFWIHMKKLMDRKLLESDIRFRIDSLCREADVVIAFPQRDVHLDSLAPVEVRMVPPREAADEEEETAHPIP